MDPVLRRTITSIVDSSTLTVKRLQLPLLYMLELTFLERFQEVIDNHSTVINRVAVLTVELLPTDTPSLLLWFLIQDDIDAIVAPSMSNRQSITTSQHLSTVQLHRTTSRSQVRLYNGITLDDLPTIISINLPINAYDGTLWARLYYHRYLLKNPISLSFCTDDLNLGDSEILSRHYLEPINFDYLNIISNGNVWSSDNVDVIVTVDDNEKLTDIIHNGTPNTLNDSRIVILDDKSDEFIHSPMSSEDMSTSLLYICKGLKNIKDLTITSSIEECGSHISMIKKNVPFRLFTRQLWSEVVEPIFDIISVARADNWETSYVNELWPGLEWEDILSSIIRMDSKVISLLQSDDDLYMVMPYLSKDTVQVRINAPIESVGNTDSILRMKDGNVYISISREMANQMIDQPGELLSHPSLLVLEDYYLSSWLHRKMVEDIVSKYQEHDLQSQRSRNNIVVNRPWNAISVTRRGRRLGH